MEIEPIITKMRKWARRTGNHYDIPLYKRDCNHHRKAEYFFDEFSEIEDVQVICSTKTKALEVQVTYKDSKGRIVVNPAVMVTPEGNMIRYHADFTRISHCETMPWVREELN